MGPWGGSTLLRSPSICLFNCTLKTDCSAQASVTSSIWEFAHDVWWRSSNPQVTYFIFHRDLLSPGYPWRRIPGTSWISEGFELWSLWPISGSTIMADLALEDAGQSPQSFGEIFLISILSKKWILRWYLFHQRVNWGSEIQSCFHIVHLREAEPRLSVRIQGFGATLCGNSPPSQCHSIPALQETTAVAEFSMFFHLPMLLYWTNKAFLSSWPKTPRR